MLFNIINNVRIICAKIVQIAKSGHPGMPLGISDLFSILWFYFYKINFLNINSINKDKLIISNGHGVLIQYVLLYYSNIYNFNDIINFRKFNSKTPGHPEKNEIIDASTGPLGQGVGIGVGIGIKNKINSFIFNKKINIINNKIWIINGDGCMMEGVSYETTSLCGVYKINNIILIYDSNNISIDGLIVTYFNENIRMRFTSLNWNIIGPVNGHSYYNIFKAYKLSLKSYFPTLIIFNTIIGFISPCKSYNEVVHGSIFNKNEFNFIIKNYCIKYIFKKKILIDNKIKYFKYFIFFYKKKYFELIRILNFIIPKINYIYIYTKNRYNCINKSTRFVSSVLLKNIFILPEITGGSADLSASNLTKNDFIGFFKKKKRYRYIKYGIREFGMSVINYGINLTKTGINFCSTFLVFMSYMYSSFRNFCISKIKNIFIFTHDSFLIGEDGPSHQPVEHLKSLRIIPRIIVFRPYNFIEVIICWNIALKLKKNIVCIILSRQNFINNEIKFYNVKNIIKGGYFVLNKKKNDLIIVSCGADLEICFICSKYLNKYFLINIFSIYSSNLLNKQKKNFKNIFINKKILFIESSNDNSILKYKSLYTFILGINKFGKSSNTKELLKYYNITKKNIIKICLYIIKKKF